MRSHWTARTMVKRFTTGVISATALLVACEREKELPTASRTPDAVPDQLSAEAPQRLRAQLERLSTMPMLLTADRLGVTEIHGRSMNHKKEHGRDGSRRKLNDVAIAADPNAHENEPTVTANPKKKQRLVAGYHFITEQGVRCQARHSSDGGKSWSAPVLMPQLGPESGCSDPVLAYAPDGSRVFYAYMDVKFAATPDPTVFLTEFDILVSYSVNDGRTWTGPFIALNGVLGVFDYDKPWIATPADGSDDGDRVGTAQSQDASKYVYVTATRFDEGCHIVFTRSTNGGTVYSAPQDLDGSPACDPVVQGSRPSGGKRGNILVGWYHSGSDGFLNGSFNIRTRYSADFGATFAPVEDAATDASEANFFLGPFGCYERWWPVMMPDVEIDKNGRGYLAYTRDPAAGDATAEEGDIRYVTSPGAPYTSWSAPVTVNDDHTVSAQGFAALDVKSGKPQATWMDTRLPLQLVAASQCPFAEDVENLEYDIFSSTRQGGGWSRNVRVTDQASLTDFNFLGDYIDLTAEIPYTIWTDRRDKLSIFDDEDDVWGSRVP
jgi:hypothetical protein